MGLCQEELWKDSHALSVLTFTTAGLFLLLEGWSPTVCIQMLGELLEFVGTDHGLK